MADEVQENQNQMATTEDNGNLPSYLQDLPVKVDVLLGSVDLTVKELLSCGQGSVIDIGKKASDPFDLYVNNVLVARGEIVMMHDRLGLKIVEVVNKPEV
ncbi:MAG: FliM/FliN family flagellar motor switch protein [Deltaproteobacteria bacterium]|nr:FliM/FliN family flagellar motor switch protein [Deltaproteobacteria bacterium]